MQKSVNLVIILLLTVFCFAIQYKQTKAANWLYIATNNSYTKYYVDIDSIQLNRKNHTIKYWEKAVKSDGYSVALLLCDYNEQAYIALQLTGYDSKGNVIISGAPPTQKQYIIPGSVSEIVLNEILKLKGIK